MKFLLSATFVFISFWNALFLICAQDNINWSFGVSEGYVFAKAELADGWYIYSMDLDENIGPVPTEVVFEPGENHQLLGDIIATPPNEKEDKAFGVVIPIHLEEVIFKQAIQLDGANVINGSILYMMCNEEGCLPPEYFTFNIEIEE
jgi:hypothetical protein